MFYLYICEILNIKIYIMITHYIIKFKGNLTRSFEFDVCNDWVAYDFDKYIYVRDNTLYIQGWRITSNQDAIQEIFRNLRDKETNIDDEKRVVECIFSIDYSGYVICLKSAVYVNKVERFLAKLLGE